MSREEIFLLIKGYLEKLGLKEITEDTVLNFMQLEYVTDNLVLHNEMEVTYTHFGGLVRVGDFITEILKSLG